MAKLSSGILGPIRGKVGDKVYYVKKGKQCVRSIAKKKSLGLVPVHNLKNRII